MVKNAMATKKMSCSQAVVQSCGRKAISMIGPHEIQTARPQDKKAVLSEGRLFVHNL
jgi:hypothetical protein